jgi:hypothetical protein
MTYTPIDDTFHGPDSMEMARFGVGDDASRASIMCEVLTDRRDMLSPYAITVGEVPALVGVYVREDVDAIASVTMDVYTALEFGLRLVKQAEWAIDLLEGDG